MQLMRKQRENDKDRQNKETVNNCQQLWHHAGFMKTYKPWWGIDYESTGDQDSGSDPSCCERLLSGKLSLQLDGFIT